VCVFAFGGMREGTRARWWHASIGGVQLQHNAELSGEGVLTPPPLGRA